MPIWANSMDQMERKIFKKICQARGTSDTSLLPQGYPISFPNASWKTGPFRRVWMPLK